VAPPSGNAARPARALIALAALIVVLLFAVVGADISNPGNWHKHFAVPLGLDLTSGTIVALKAERPGGGAPSSAEMSQALAIMSNRVNGAGFTGASVVQQGNNVITVSVPGGSAQSVVNLVKRTAQLQLRQVLLEAPNTSTALPTPTPSASAAPASSATPSPGGRASPSASGKPTASASPTPSAKASPKPTASGGATPSPSASPAATSGVSTWQQAQGDAALVNPHVKALFNKLNCANKNWQKQVGYTAQQYNTQGIQTVSCGQINGVWYKYALDKAHVVGTMIASATAQPDTTSTGWLVNINFKSDGTSAFATLTSQMFAKYQGSPSTPENYIAMVLDGSVASTAYIQAAILNGQAQISGNFSQSQATTLANQLSYGALPLSFTPEEAQSISPTLGHDQLDAGLIAAGIGLILVLIYLIVYYRALALVSALSLILAGWLAYLSVLLLGEYARFSMTLAGIAGLIVAIGITADSFVVFFERLRDEVRDGRSLRAAVERGWVRARRTILVSDTVSFLAAALLYIFAIGDVRGFAFTLGLTTIIDVVVVFTFTKPMVTLLARTKFYGGGHPMSGLDPARLGARAPWRGTARPVKARVRTSTAKES
jgi:preprotein translocase subunit SecD